MTGFCPSAHCPSDRPAATLSDRQGPARDNPATVDAASMATIINTVRRSPWRTVWEPLGANPGERAVIVPDHRLTDRPQGRPGERPRPDMTMTMWLSVW